MSNRGGNFTFTGILIICQTVSLSLSCFLLHSYENRLGQSCFDWKNPDAHRQVRAQRTHICTGLQNVLILIVFPPQKLSAHTRHLTQDILYCYIPPRRTYNWQDLWTFIPPLPTHANTHLLYHTLPLQGSNPSALFPPRLTLKKRQCLLICQSDVVLLWRWWGSVTVGHTPPAARGSMINQAGSESNCWQQKHTDSWFGRQWSHSLYLTCHGQSKHLLHYLLTHLERWRETLIYCIALIDMWTRSHRHKYL